MLPVERRYDIDWLRVIAIAMLLIYHIVIIFQPWAYYIGFIQSSETSEAIWIPMALINIWRIPLLFFVSGMGVCFALRRRDWKQLLLDRAKRILLPLVFGSFFIVPIHAFIFQNYYQQLVEYNPNVGHLWFLANICIYVLQIIGLAFLDKRYDYAFFNFLRKLLNRPYTIYIFIVPFIFEAVLTNPEFYSLFVGSGHGFLLGMLAFFFGFVFIAIGNSFWIAVEKMKYTSLIIAFSLYLIRLFIYELNGPNFLTSIESICWIFSIFGFGYKYLNKPSKILSYLSESVYPIYIIHMIFLFWAADIFLPLNLSIELNLILIILFTFICCYVTYEFFIKRVSLIRPLFGLKQNRISPKLKEANLD